MQNYHKNYILGGVFMYSFTDLSGKRVVIDDDKEIDAQTITDIVTKKVTDYIIFIDSEGYLVSKEVYDAVDYMYL